MASSVSKRGSSLQVRRGPSPKLVKVQTQLANLRKRAVSTAGQHAEVIAGVGATAAFVALEKSLKEKKQSLPTVMGLDPALLYGATLYLFGRKLAGGKSGKLAESAGAGLLSYAAGRSMYRGSVKVSGYESPSDDDAMLDVSDD